jgi:cathepsin B
MHVGWLFPFLVAVVSAGLCDIPGRFVPVGDSRSRFYGKNCEQISQSLGLTLRPGQGLIRVVNSSIPIPTSFDWRTERPECVHGVRDQGMCGACWAFATTRPLAWRFCLFASDLQLAPQFMLDCDQSCYEEGEPCEAGCQGGFLDLAWQFLRFTGAVPESCLPYTGTVDSTCPALPGCTRATALDGYQIQDFAVEDIQREIIEFGPVTAGLEVFSDFLTYSSGVYTQQSDDVVGAHAVTLIGWGSTRAGVDYWIAENQWGTAWGEDGYLLIRRGTNEVGIEQYIYAGRPNATGVDFDALQTRTTTTTSSATRQSISVICIFVWAFSNWM